MSLLPDGLGWLATAIFAVSYFCKRTIRLRLVQGAAAFVWMLYGAWIGSRPIVVANILVCSLALYSAWRDRRERIDTPVGARE